MRKFLILVLLVFVACGGDRARDKFLDLMSHTEFFYQESKDAFSRDGETITIKEYGSKYKFKLSKVYANKDKSAYIGVYVYKTQNENSYYDDGQYFLTGFIGDLGFGSGWMLYAIDDILDDVESMEVNIDDLINELLIYAPIGSVGEEDYE